MYTPQQLQSLARRKVLDVARFEHMGMLAARRGCYRLVNAGIRAYRRGQDPVTAALAELYSVVSPFADAMLGAALSGASRSKRLLNSNAFLALAQSPLDQIIKQYQAKLKLNEAQITQLRNEFEKYSVVTIGQFGDSIDRKLTATMQNIIEEGLHVQDGEKKLYDAFAAAGVTPTNSFQVEAVLRTQTQMAYSAAQWHANQDPVAQEILWGYRYTTVGDDRVRPEHEALEGVTAPKDDPIWHKIWTPNGYACRCQIIELFEPEEIVLPAESIELEDGKIIYPGPDKGFEFNPGELFDRIESVINDAVKVATPPPEVIVPPGLQKQIDRAFEETKVQYTPEEVKAINRYLAIPGGSSASYIPRLEAGLVLPRDNEAKLVEQLQSAIEKTPDVETVGYRGVVLKEGAVPAVGEVLDRKVFTSWSADETVASGYSIVQKSSQGGGERVVFEYKGSFKNIGPVAPNPSGKELWLMRDPSGLRVKSVERKYEKGVDWITRVVLEDSPSPAASSPEQLLQADVEQITSKIDKTVVDAGTKVTSLEADRAEILAERDRSSHEWFNLRVLEQKVQGGFAEKEEIELFEENKARYKQLTEERETLRQVSLKLNERINKVKQEVRESVIASLRVEETRPLRVEVSDNIERHHPKIKSAALEAAKFVQSVTAGRVEPVSIMYQDGDRAFYLDDVRRVYLTGTDKATAVHELGHHLENSLPQRHEAAKAFLESRTAGAETKQLKQVSRAYCKDEVYKDGKFISPYVGKIYKHRATEVISMGLQALYEDPMKFMRDDPEHFKLIIRVLRMR